MAFETFKIINKENTSYAVIIWSHVFVKSSLNIFSSSVCGLYTPDINHFCCQQSIFQC
jgi:hypothetical protein